MLLVQLLQTVGGFSFDWMGIRPRTLGGLAGIVLMPLVHGGFEHVLNNMVSLVLGAVALGYFYPTLATSVHVQVILLGGFMVWLLARPSVHIGASGWTYGLMAFLMLSGFVRREPRAAAVAAVAVMLNAGFVWGLLPIERGISFEAHAYSAIVGAVLAVAYRNKDRQMPRYDWQNAPDDSNESGSWDYRRHIRTDEDTQAPTQNTP